MADVRHEAVVTFLALLEMSKLRLIQLTQEEGEDEIFIARAADDLRERVLAGVAGDKDYR
jgi:chromatin segregation and condensation protein Rec8/ScpA/Scc1 (kleisin family)